MELSKESKHIVDKDFELIDSIIERVYQKDSISIDNAIQISIAIYLKRGNDLRLVDEDD